MLDTPSPRREDDVVAGVERCGGASCLEAIRCDLAPPLGVRRVLLLLLSLSLLLLVLSAMTTQALEWDLRVVVDLETTPPRRFVSFI